MDSSVGEMRMQSVGQLVRIIMNSIKRRDTWFKKVLRWELIRDGTSWDDRKRRALDNFKR